MDLFDLRDCLVTIFLPVLSNREGILLNVIHLGVYT